MDDLAFIRIHRFESLAPSGSGAFVSNLDCQLLKSSLSLLAVTFRVDEHPGVLLCIFILNDAGQILERIKRLAAFTDQGAYFFPCKADIKHIIQNRTYNLVF